MAIIRQPKASVDANRVQKSKDYYLGQSASAASTFKYQGVSNTGVGPVQELKESISFEKLLEMDDHRLVRSGNGAKCLCPFHRERTASFWVSGNDAWAKCYGCDWSGDIFSYVMKRDDVGFSEALQKLQALKLGIHDMSRSTSFEPFTKGSTTEENNLSDTERAILASAPERLIKEPELRKIVARTRNWKPETILELAQDGSLGWYRGALGFIYSTGLKLRNWPHREFAWEFGHQTLWRGDQMEKAIHVYLTEGETDAITLVDLGLEKIHGSVVVGVPGASAFKKEWAYLFDDKHVTLCFDGDSAGELAATNIANHLRYHAKDLKNADLASLLRPYKEKLKSSGEEVLK